MVTPRSSGNPISPSSTHPGSEIGGSALRGAEQRGAIVAVSGDQLQPTAPVQDGDNPVAIMLDLVQPVVAFRRPNGWRCYSETDTARQRRWRRAGWKSKVLHGRGRMR